MQTTILEPFRSGIDGQIAESILRKCVHCGFCNATCPTYRLLGDELDGPRGRIYLIKQLLEGAAPTSKMQLHLDRCLLCRACETTCPSGVRYSQLLEIGRNQLAQRLSRSLQGKFERFVIRKVLGTRFIFRAILTLGRQIKKILPLSIGAKIPPKQFEPNWPPNRHQRKMLVLDGCVQPYLTPTTNAVAAGVLDQLGISLIRVVHDGCCGALDCHTSAPAVGRQRARALIDSWWSLIEQGVEAIVITASGCGIMVREYANLFRNDPVYGDKAKVVSRLCRDLSEILVAEDYHKLKAVKPNLRVAYHAPCSLQHGQKIKGEIETILTSMGYRLCQIKNEYLCCGAAGTYALLQPDLSAQLRSDKLKSLMQQSPQVIVSANVGCQYHLAVTSNVPVKHWIELLV